MTTNKDKKLLERRLEAQENLDKVFEYMTRLNDMGDVPAGYALFKAALMQVSRGGAKILPEAQLLIAYGMFIAISEMKHESQRTNS